jgi:hypothetical protein
MTMRISRVSPARAVREGEQRCRGGSRFPGAAIKRPQFYAVPLRRPVS